MPLFAGPVLLPDRVEEGWLHVEEGQIVACGLDASSEPPARPERPVARGWIVPMAVNAHTHAGDTFLRDRPGKPQTLPELVGPGGWKHKHLHAATDEDLQAGIRQLTAESAAAGVSRMLDFREQGTAGLRVAQGHWPVDVSWFGRPQGYGFEEEEAEAVLALADGLGISAMRDFPSRSDLEAWVEEAHDRRKPVAMHVSEGTREDMEAALALDPALLVHACHATRTDLRAVADAGVPVAVCPRSNRTFGLKAPVPAMLADGVTVALGTDNGMLQDGDIWQEAALAKALWDLDDETVLRMATYHGYRAAGTRPPAFAPGPAHWLVLPALPQASRGKPILAPGTEER